MIDSESFSWNIYDDGSVENDRGEQVGYRTADGIIVDMQHNPIGIEEIRRTSIETGVNCFTSLDTVNALLRSLESDAKNHLEVIDIATI